MAVLRTYAEKKPAYSDGAKHLLQDIKSFLQIPQLEKVRIFNRYDVEGIDAELFERCKTTIFSEPQLDVIYNELPKEDCAIFACEYLPGQFDQRADSCAQCIQIVSGGDKPLVTTARVYYLYGCLTAGQIDTIKKYIINPVESREAPLPKPETLVANYAIPSAVETVENFIDLSAADLEKFVADYSLAMDLDDITFCQNYFRGENRNPTITEIRVLDTYWSDHCRHTTFSTNIDNVEFEDSLEKSSYEKYLEIRGEVYGQRNKPVTLMDLATIGAKYLKRQGLLKNLDESEEINACSVKIEVDVEGETEEWLLMFKNETHNHPTEIEPFGGAATCIGGAIRDPLSGRSYVYQAMRVTGAADPLVPVSQTLAGKLPQRKLVTTAAAGYSSYGNQIGLATGLVEELYHPGYLAKRMEIGAVVGAVPLKNVRREGPQAGDIVILIGGRTGRDGCGGATGSSKSHTIGSLESCGAEVQKGNAPEERKLQRLFRNADAARLIKRCNDFGAGGVAVAIGELAEGIHINLDAVPKKYAGLDGTELAISESQERMAVVVEARDADKFIAFAHQENLEATVVACITEEPHLVMEWNGNIIVNIARAFLDTNGAEKHTTAFVSHGKIIKQQPNGSTKEKFAAVLSDLNVCSKKGLAQRFDSTIGGGTVLMPFGGKHQLTPAQAMVAKIPVEGKETKTCSAMAYGFNPYLSRQSPYHGAFLAVVESVSKLVACGASYKNCYLTFQEYFERLGSDPKRWGKPLSALLGAMEAQLQLGIAAIGGKDSMSGSFENIDVPPALVSFAIAPANTDNIISPEFKRAGSKVILITPKVNENGLVDISSLKDVFATVEGLISGKKVLSAYTPTYGGMAEALVKMCLGNRIGLNMSKSFDVDKLFGYMYGSFILEVKDDCMLGELIGYTAKDYSIRLDGEVLDLNDLQRVYEDKLEAVFPCNTGELTQAVKSFSYSQVKTETPKLGITKPRVLIPVFPGTNCEYDTAKAFNRAGGNSEILVIKNLTPNDIAESVKAMAKAIEQSQIIAIPGGFSGGDEPDGSGKFITAFFRNPVIKEKVLDLLKNQDGLMCGICNGFQALIKLGLVPYGEIIDTDENCPTLTFNTIGRHQSALVHTRIASNKSPWLMDCNVGDIHTIAISHGEGRFVAGEQLVQQLAKNGQIATQYVDLGGNPTMDINFNPNHSLYAIEGITSPDGRIFGKMGHSERCGDNLYKNVDGNKEQRMFSSAVSYFA